MKPDKDMATRDEQAQIAVLQTQMATVIKGVDMLNTKFDSMTAMFVPKGEFDEFKKRWALSHAIVGIVSSVLTGLVVFFITRG